MNLYFLGILAALVVFFAVGIGAGRMVKDTNDYYVSGRNAPTLLIVGSLIASFLSTGAFLGDTGEVYSGFFIGIVTVGVIQATGYIYGAGFFGRYIRRSEVTTLPEYFGRRFCSKHLRRLSAVILLVSVSAYLLSAIQGVATLMSSITGYDYRLCAVIVWLAFTAFTIYSGSPGVLLTDTIMFLVFLAAALVAVPFLIRAGGGWFAGIEALANSDTMPGILSWAGNPDYLYPDGVSNTVWAVTYGIVWALVVAISPWQTSRYLMAKDEHVVLRSSVWSSMGVMVVTIALYFSAAFVRNINGSLPGSEAMIWAATHVLPPVIGMLLLIGISAAGISSASTFLSLIGFSVVNDILPEAESDRKKLARSRWAMLAVSLIVLRARLPQSTADLPHHVFRRHRHRGRVESRGFRQRVEPPPEPLRRVSRHAARLSRLRGREGDLRPARHHTAGLGGCVFHRHRAEYPRSGDRLCAPAADAGRTARARTALRCAHRPGRGRRLPKGPAAVAGVPRIWPVCGPVFPVFLCHSLQPRAVIFPGGDRHAGHAESVLRPHRQHGRSAQSAHHRALLRLPGRALLVSHRRPVRHRQRSGAV
ncbi:MAG: sodium:solute symporter family protein [Oscillospiraceae bacterium]